MMTEKRQTYTAAFTREAVRLVTENGYGVAEAARNLGIKAHMLRRWKCPCEAQANGAFPGKGQLLPEHAERSRLREEHKRLRMEREMLKKRQPSVPASRAEVCLYGPAPTAVARIHPVQGARGEPEWVLCRCATANRSLYKC